jgi:hypothetical protein
MSPCLKNKGIADQPPFDYAQGSGTFRVQCRQLSMAEHSRSRSVCLSRSQNLPKKDRYFIRKHFPKEIINGLWLLFGRLRALAPKGAGFVQLPSK